MTIVSKSSINMLARIDAIEYDTFSYENTSVPPIRYDTPWMQELYEQYFWSNLRELRGEDVIYG